MRSLLVALLLAPCVTFAQTGGGYDLTHNTIDGGGGRAAGGIYVIDATIGQPDAAGAAGGSFVLRGGFWGGLVPAATPVLTATATSAPTRTATVSTPVTTAPPTTTATAPPTPMATATVAPTGSATAIDATRTPMASPTPSTTVTPGGGCPGDCDDGGSVTVDELITGVSIALGTIDLEQCQVFDLDAGGTVTVDELIAAIDSALNGCR